MHWGRRISRDGSLFTRGVRGRGVLRASRVGGSPKLAGAQPTEQPRRIEDVEDGLGQVPPPGASPGLRVLQKFSNPCKNAKGQIVPIRNLTAA